MEENGRTDIEILPPHTLIFILHLHSSESSARQDYDDNSGQYSNDRCHANDCGAGQLSSLAKHGPRPTTRSALSTIGWLVEEAFSTKQVSRSVHCTWTRHLDQKYMYV